MKELSAESGIQEYRINGGAVLCFDHQDPHPKERLAQAESKLRAMEKQLTRKLNAVKKKPAHDAGAAAIALMCKTDKRMKKILNDIFGLDNDFDKILEGVNLMAVAGNGKRVITNLLDVLQPIMEDGAQACAKGEVEAAKLNREQRRAMQR